MKNTSREVIHTSPNSPYICVMRFWVLIGLFLGVQHTPWAQQNDVFVVSGRTIDSRLEGYVYTAQNLKISQIKKVLAQKVQFKKVKETLANFGVGDDENWICFDILNQDTDSKSLVLFLDQTFLEKADFYQFQGDSLITQIELSQSILAQNRPLGYPNYVYPFVLQSHQHNSIFLRMKVSEIKAVSRALIRLSDQNSFHKNYRRTFFSFGVLVGFLSLAFWVGVALYFFHRKAVYCVYGVYIFTVLFYYLANSGYLNGLYASSFVGSARFESAIMWVSSALHIWFIESFLNFQNQSPKSFRYVSRVLILSSVSLGICYVFFAIPAILAYLSRILLFVMAILTVALSVWAIIKRQKQTLMYSLATFPAIVLIIYFLFTALTLLPLYPRVFNLAFPFTVFEILVFGFGLVYLFNEERKAIEYKLQEEQTQIASRIISAQEQERQRIAQDLHDDLGSSLSLLKVRLEEINKSVGNQLFNEINIANKSVEDLRQIAYNLMPMMFLERGLLGSLQEFLTINHLQQTVELIYSGDEERFDLDKGLHIFRVVKELVNNALKHAKATKIEVQLIYFEAFLYLSVEDNGVGIAQNQENGNGLKNVTLRVSHLNGNISQESSANGTLIAIEIPYGADSISKNKTSAR